MREIPARLELKFRVPARKIPAIRADVKRVCELDPYCPEEGRGYPLWSLYFDTPDYAFHRATLRRDSDRFKLRARVYDETTDVHLEVKRKTHDTIRKTRAHVPRDRWVELATGRGTLTADPQSTAALEGFAYEMLRGACQPAALVYYEREAYVSTVDPYARVTFDRSIEAFEPNGMDLSLRRERSVPLDKATEFGALESPVVVELKAEHLIPSWMTDLVAAHGLRRIGFSKYGRAIDRLMGPSGRMPGWRDAFI